MPRAARACSTIGCPNLSNGGRCDECRRESDRQRGTATERGYNSRGHHRFRIAVLACDPTCRICSSAPSTVADHWPLSRRELEAQGLNPNDPVRGRGLCKTCHDRSTATTQPGGWHA